MAPVEVPDWPLPVSSSMRRKIQREDGTHRAWLKRGLSDLAAAMGTGAEAQLVGFARASTLLDELTREAVDEARGDGVPWSVIGAALGMSKQAAQQRYGRGSA